MLKFDAAGFVRVTNSLVWMQATVQHIGKAAYGESPGEPVTEEYRNHAATEVRDLISHLRALGARVSVVTAEELLGKCESTSREFTWEKLNISALDLMKTVKREMGLIHLFIVSDRHAEYFDSTTPLFGQDVGRKFPTAAFEIEEAGKCIALGRPTAAVFHLMRVMEIGLRSVALCLGVHDPLKDRNWGAILKKMKDEVDNRSKANPAWIERQFFSEIYGSLDAVRVAWRNSTMHVANKYTDDEAEHLWAGVKGFMKKLATRCDEAGTPSA